jgi:hypothetical protein
MLRKERDTITSRFWLGLGHIQLTEDHDGSITPQIREASPQGHKGRA